MTRQRQQANAARNPTINQRTGPTINKPTVGAPKKRRANNKFDAF